MLNLININNYKENSRKANQNRTNIFDTYIHETNLINQPFKLIIKKLSQSKIKVQCNLYTFAGSLYSVADENFMDEQIIKVLKENPAPFNNYLDSIKSKDVTRFGLVKTIEYQNENDLFNQLDSYAHIMMIFQNQLRTNLKSTRFYYQLLKNSRKDVISTH